MTIEPLSVYLRYNQQTDTGAETLAPLPIEMAWAQRYTRPRIFVSLKDSCRSACASPEDLEDWQVLPLPATRAGTLSA